MVHHGSHIKEATSWMTHQGSHIMNDASCMSLLYSFVTWRKQLHVCTEEQANLLLTNVGNVAVERQQRMRKVLSAKELEHDVERPKT